MKMNEATLKYYYDNGDGSDPSLTANPNYPQTDMKQGYRVAGVMVALKYLGMTLKDGWSHFRSPSPAIILLDSAG